MNSEQLAVNRERVIPVSKRLSIPSRFVGICFGKSNSRTIRVNCRSSALSRWVRLLVGVVFLLGIGRNLNAQTAPTLIAHWAFEDENANDNVGGYDGSVYGATWRSGVKSADADGTGSFEFDGSNDFIDTAIFDTDDSFTISAWINPQNTTNRAIIAKNIDASQNGNQFLLGFYSGGYHVTLLDEGFTAGTPETGWHHLIVTGEATGDGGTVVKLYRNGVKLWQYQYGTTINAGGASRAWTIGQEWDGDSRSDFFDGYIDDVRIYNGAMSDSDVAALTAGYAHTCAVPGLYGSVPAAIMDVNCDIVVVGAGTFFVNTVVSSNVLVRGAGEASTFLQVVAGGDRRAFANQPRNSFTLENLTVKDGHTTGTSYGAGIYNNSNGQLFLNNVTFDNNRSIGGEGGAIYNLGRVIGDSVTSTNNYTARTGGLIHNEVDATALFTNLLSDGDTGRWGGAVAYNKGELEISDSTLQNNLDTDCGGAIYNRDATLIVRGTTIQNMTANCGGAITHYEGTLTVEDSHFIDNIATNPGGALNLADGVATVHNSTFSGNAAKNGGAIKIGFDSVALTVSDSTFADNSVAENGGAIFAEDDGSVQVSGSVFVGNSADLNGGAIYSEVPLDVYDSTFTDNQASKASSPYGSGGGAIRAVRASGAPVHTLVISGTTFSANAGGSGGAIYNTGATSQITSTNFISNSATANGGGISTWYNMDVWSSSFVENSADDAGGAIFGEGGFLRIFDSEMANNTAHTGGGVALYYGGALEIADSVLHHNEAVSNGGAIMAPTTVKLRDSTLYANESGRDGGAIFASNGAGNYFPKVELLRVTLSGNTASNRGGGIDAGGVEDGSYVTITDSTITDNSSEVGAGVASGYSTMTIAGSLIAGNSGGDCMAYSGSNLTGVISADTTNLDSDGSCDNANTSSIINLAPLADNGGTTPTRLPLNGSAAIDGYLCDAGVDQRGAVRPQGLLYQGDFALGDTCDYGSVEVNSDTLATYDSAFERFKTLVTSRDYQPAVDFRTAELTRPSIGASTTITNVTLSYITFSNGRLYYRHCADRHYISCRAWDDLSSAEKDERVPNHALDPFDAESHDLHRQLLQALLTYSWISENRPVQSGYDGELNVVREMANMPLIYGNEFMVDALRFSFGAAENAGVTTGAGILQAEIDELARAKAEFAVVNRIFLWATELQLSDGSAVSDQFTLTDYELFAIASERYVEAAIEMIERRRLLGISAEILLDEIDTVHSEQYLHANLIANAIADSSLATSEAEAQAIFLDNGGWQLLNNLEQLSNLAESIRAGSNILGFDPLYVPRSSFDDLFARMGTLGSCNLETGVVTGGSGELFNLLDKECKAGAADRFFDETGVNFQTELDNLATTLGDELIELCGIDPADPNADTTRCVDGEMGINYSDLEAAQLAVGLSWQRANNIPKLIEIEQQRAGQVIRMTLTTGQQLSALEHSIAKARAYRTVTTSATTTENWAPGSDPNNPNSKAYWIDFAKDGVNCILSGVTLGALGDGCQGNNDNLFGAIGELAGVEDKPTSIDTVETISDPSQLQIGNFKGIQQIREAERDASIENANSNAEIKRLLLEQSDLLIEYELAVQELNRVIVERNLLIQRHRRALNEYRRATAKSADHYIQTPAYRIIRDVSAANAERTRDRVVQTTYLTLKALEYELLAEPVSNNVCGITGNLYEALYQARTADHLATILCEVSNINLPIDDSPGNKYAVSLSIAEDIWGLTDQKISGMLPFKPDPASQTWPADLCGTAEINDAATLRHCLFQERLRQTILTDSQLGEVLNDDTLLGDDQSIYFAFDTQLERDVEQGELFRWNIRIAPPGPCGSGTCNGVRARIVTQQAINHAITVRLTHQGQATYRNGSGAAVYYNPGLTRLLGQAIPAGWPAGRAVNAVISAEVNNNGSGTSSIDLSNLSASTTDWRFHIDLSGTGSVLDVEQISDFEIEMDTLALTVSRARADQWRSESTRSATPSSRKQTAPTFNTDLIGGQYSGKVFVTSPAPLGIFDSGMTLTRTGSTITGQLCGACGSLFDTVPVMGVFTNTGTLTNTFHVVSQPFVDLIDGQTVTRTVTLQGATSQQGDVIQGSYREEIVGYGDDVMLVEGTFIENRPIRDNPITSNVPTAVGLYSQQTTTIHLPLFLIGLLTTVTVVARRRWRASREVSCKKNAYEGNKV